VITASSRVGHTARLDHDLLRPLGQIGHPQDRADQVRADAAADAAIGQADHAVPDLGDQLRIDVDGTEVVDQHGNATTVLALQDAVEQRGLSRAEKPGHDGDRDRRGLS
jgi:hypothetical protein